MKLDAEHYLHIADPVQKFIGRIDWLEKRFKGKKLPPAWLVPKEELVAVRDVLEKVKASATRDEGWFTPSERRGEV